MASLSSVRIPKDGVPALRRLADLDDDQASALIDALSSKEVRSVRAVVGAVNGVIENQWSEDEITSFVANLISMSTLGTSHNFSADELADKITDLVGSNLDDAGRKRLPSRLAALLGAGSFRAFSKAIDVSRESDRVLHISRIVSDIRAVFQDDPSEEPFGALVVHTLRLDYFEEGEVKTASFTLNANDLAELKYTVERAEAKGTTLSGILERAELAQFDLSGDSDD